MDSNFHDLIVKVLKENDRLTTSVLTKKVLRAFPDLSKSAISWRLHKLKSDGIIHSLSYGTYSLQAKASFTPSLSTSAKRLYNKILKDYPGVELCVWESKWFDEFLPEAQANNFIVAEVEKELSEAVYNSLSDWSKKIFFNPDADLLSRHIPNLKDAIIIKSIISESPCTDVDSVRVAALEKLLVDSLAEPELFAFLKDSKVNVVLNTVMEKYNISKSKMKRYSKRRSQHHNLSKLLSKHK